MNCTRFAFIFSIFFALSTLAETSTTLTTSSELKSENSSSYFLYFSGGTGFTKHSDKFADTEADFRALGDRRGGTGVLELPGLYFAHDSRTLIGFLPSLYAEDYSENYLSATSVALSRFNFDVSYWHFFGFEDSRIGVGPSYRIDFGHSYIHEFRKLGGVEDDQYHNGPNLKASLGYGLEMKGYGFVNFSLGAFGVSAGGVVAEGLDATIGFLL